MFLMWILFLFVISAQGQDNAPPGDADTKYATNFIANRHWPDGKIKYWILPTGNSASWLIPKVIDGLDFLSNETDYAVVFEKPAPLDGSMGMCGLTEWTYYPLIIVYVGNRCKKGLLTHEIMHALGFEHEFTRRDRSKYVTINCDNIRAGREVQFDVCYDCVYTKDPSWKVFQDFDYSSVTMYSSKALGEKNTETITPKDPAKKELMGKYQLSESDIERLKFVYGKNYKKPEQVNEAIKNLEYCPAKEIEMK
uniref:Metalloendopeptidase n=1 Tax=Acrobeloides nanus TaxID=290746 RepID=A0A914C6X7_9BILA